MRKVDEMVQSLRSKSYTSEDVDLALMAVSFFFFSG